MPSRIQRQRSRGWRQPINAIYVGRPTKWGNPYKVGVGHHTAEEAVNLYRRDLIAGSLPLTIDDVRRELKGKELICWCKPGAPCHADVLLEVANGGREERSAVRTEASNGRERTITSALKDQGNEPVQTVKRTRSGQN
jgi:Domain of unknown function (DUF4326)